VETSGFVVGQDAALGFCISFVKKLCLCIMKDDTALLVEELLHYFVSEKYTIIGARDNEGYRTPEMLHNDGYGDQNNKRFVIGVVKATHDDLESPHSLTQYDVFFDHKNAQNGKPSQVCFLLPPGLIAQFTAIITHYIHRDYWNNMMIIRSKISDEDS
jgi:hypothetical protein